MTWSTCSWVIRTAVAPSSASGAEKDPGSITSVTPACSSRTHAWPSLRSRMIFNLRGYCAVQLRKAIDELKRGVGDFAPATVNHERVAAVRDFGDLGHTRVVL